MPRSTGPKSQSGEAPSLGDRAKGQHVVPAARPSSMLDPTHDVAEEDFLFHLYRGSELLQENRVLEAKEELEFASAMRPNDPKGQDLLGAVYFRLGVYPLAIQIYERLSLQFPRDASIKINLALSFLKTGQAAPAQRTLNDVVRLHPEHKRAWGYLGIALQKLGELEQAQLAFERGGHALMAKRVNERRQRGSMPAGESHEGDEGVRGVAETAFSELDAGALRFELAEPGSRKLADGPWHMLELGIGAPWEAGSARPRSPYARTQPPPEVREAPQVAESISRSPPSLSPSGRGSLPSVAASPRVAPPTFEHDTRAKVLPVTGEASEENPAAPSPLVLPPDCSMALHETGALLVRITEEQSFAARLDALRVVEGGVTTRVLHRRTRDADTNDVLGGLGSPMVRVSGSAQLVLGARTTFAIVVLTLRDSLAFLREDMLLGFELRLAYENGRLAIEPAGETIRASGEAVPVVQLRGSGGVALEVARQLASVPCAAGRGLFVRREWIVGWIGRLVPRALTPSESPSGQRGLIGFSGDGTVLVCPG